MIKETAISKAGKTEIIKRAAKSGCSPGLLPSTKPNISVTNNSTKLFANPEKCIIN